jgi:hypothetical protein
MHIIIKGKIKEIGKRDYISRYLFERRILIETDEDTEVSIQLQCFKGKEDYSALVEDLKLQEGDYIECECKLHSRKHSYRYYTNISCYEIIKHEY